MSDALPRTFAARPGYRKKCLLLVLAFVGFLVFSVIGFSIDPPQGNRIAAVIFVTLFWGAWLTLAVWNWIDAKTGRFEVTFEGVTKHGRTSRVTIFFDQVRSVFWGMAAPGSIHLKTNAEKLRIDLDWFDPEDRLWWIRLIREKTPDANYTHWEMFCRKFALPLRENLEGDLEPLTPEEVERYRKGSAPALVALFGISAIISVLQVWFQNKWGPAVLTLFACIAIVVLRLRTPSDRYAVRKYQPIPGQARFVMTILLYGLPGLAGWFLVRRVIHLQVLFAAAWFVGFLLIALFLDPTRKFVKQQSEKAVREWVEKEEPSQSSQGA
jgi:hypothetical protein